MTLLNGLLSLGALALTIPLAIHLLFRSRFRTLDWGAMQLLDDVIRVNHRRVQLLQWLLLLLRCSIPVLLAFCLARPVLTGVQSAPGDVPQTLVLAIDDSRSMSAVAGGTSRIAQARRAAADILAALSRRDEVILLQSSDGSRPPIVTGKFAAASRLDSIDAQAGPVDLPKLIRQSLAAADSGSHAHRRVVVISDFQSGDLADHDLESLRRQGEYRAGNAGGPTLALLNLGRDSDQLDNVSVDAIAADSSAVVSQCPASFTASIRNSADHPIHGLTVVWSIAERIVHTENVSIEPRATLAVRLETEFPRTGVHPLSLSIEVDDAIQSDNRRMIGVDVIEQARVLIVDGDPSRQPLQGESDFLVLALSPFADRSGTQSDAIEATVVGPLQVESAIRQSSPNVLVLANVPQLADAAKQVVADFVDRGGALVLFDGDQVVPESYNNRWRGSDPDWVLPASLGHIIREPEAKSTVAPASAVVNPRFPPWRVLVDPDDPGSQQFGVNAYRSISSRPEIQATTLMSSLDGRPLAILADRGAGRIVQFAFACDVDGSELPLRPMFVPAMQQLMLYLAGSQTDATSAIGQVVSVPVGDLIGDQNPALYRYSVQRPDRSSIAVVLQNSPQPPAIRFLPTRPGIIRFRAQPQGAAAADSARSQIRVIDVPAVESSLRDADPERLQAAAAAVKATIFSDTSSLLAADKTARHGREIWRWLLVLVLIAAFGELVLQQWLGHGAPLSPTPVAMVSASRADGRSLRGIA